MEGLIPSRETTHVIHLCVNAMSKVVVLVDKNAVAEIEGTLLHKFKKIAKIVMQLILSLALMVRLGKMLLAADTGNQVTSLVTFLTEIELTDSVHQKLHVVLYNTIVASSENSS